MAGTSLISMRSLEEDWEIQKNAQIGSGTYGKVHKARKRATTSTFAAVKVITLEPTDDFGLIENEIKMMNKCNHPNIVRLFGSYLNQSKLYIVMEFCGMGSVQDIYHAIGPLEEIKIASVLRETLLGLEYLHGEGVVHRDIKGANILLTEDGGVKLADFGVSTQLTGSEKRRTYIGTPYWMAPEVANVEKTKGYDCLCDLWAVGICAIEFAEMQPPLFDLHPYRFLHLLASGKVKTPTLKDKKLWTDSMHSFIKCALVKNPRRRPNASQLLKHPFVNQANMGAHQIRDMCQKMRQMYADMLRQQERKRRARDEVPVPPQSQLAFKPVFVRRDSFLDDGDDDADRADSLGRDGPSTADATVVPTSACAVAAAPVAASSSSSSSSSSASSASVTTVVAASSSSSSATTTAETGDKTLTAAAAVSGATDRLSADLGGGQEVWLRRNVDGSKNRPTTGGVGFLPARPSPLTSSKSVDSSARAEFFSSNSGSTSAKKNGVPPLAMAESSHLGSSVPPVASAPFLLDEAPTDNGSRLQRSGSMGSGRQRRMHSPYDNRAVQRSPLQDHLILLGSDQGIYLFNLNELHEAQLIVLYKRTTHWLHIMDRVLMSISGKNRQLVRHELVRLIDTAKIDVQFPTLQKMEDKLKQVVPKGRLDRYSQKLPDTKGTIRCAVIRHFYSGYRYLCAAQTDRLLLYQWYDPLHKYMLMKSYVPCRLPEQLSIFEMAIVPGKEFPLVCYGVTVRQTAAGGINGQHQQPPEATGIGNSSVVNGHLNGSVAQSTAVSSVGKDPEKYPVELHLIDLNEAPSPYDVLPGAMDDFSSLSEVVAVQQLDKETYMVCFGHYVKIVNERGRVRTRSRRYRSELQFDFPVSSVVALQDSVLAFHLHGMQGRSFRSNEVVQELVDPSKEYRVVGSDKMIVLESRPTNGQEDGPVDLYVVAGHE